MFDSFDMYTQCEELVDEQTLFDSLYEYEEEEYRNVTPYVDYGYYEV